MLSKLRNRKKGILLVEIMISIALLTLILVIGTTYTKEINRLSVERDNQIKLEYITYGAATYLSGYSTSDLSNITTADAVLSPLELTNTLKNSIIVTLNSSNRTLTCKLGNLQATYKIP
ncbi:hypothetical protein [Clostridium tertium]|uniref:hypothetical protein n=1 Tax=Clostridium tertium TaxID=1559 RepID=UPI0023B226B8|nr:hypothetical protein [Clostridium tertium]